MTARQHVAGEALELVLRLRGKLLDLVQMLRNDGREELADEVLEEWRGLESARDVLKKIARGDA